MQNYRIGFFIDGFTLKKVNEYYRFFHPFRSRLDFKGLKNWVKSEALNVFRPSRPVSWETHYYHPYLNPSKRSWHTPGILRFEQQLLDAGMQIHYSEKVLDANRPNMALQDDAVIFSCYSKINAIVLLSTQGQFSSLPERVGAYNVPVLLLGWNFSYCRNENWVRWKTDSRLRFKSSYYVAMDRVIETMSVNDPLCRGIFQNEKRLIRSFVRSCGVNKVIATQPDFGNVLAVS